MFNFLAPINITSYGLTGLNICKALNKLEQDFSLFPIHSRKNISLEKKEDIEYIRDGIERAKMFDPNAPCVRLWHQNELDKFVGSGPRVGFPIFELDRFNKLEMHHLKNVDYLFVTCEWAKQVLVNNGISANTISVVPLGVDSDVFFEKPMWSRSSDYSFLNIGKLEKRKGHDFIIDVFNKAFEPSDKVCLKLSVFNFGVPKDEYQRYKNMAKETKMGSKIHFVERLPYLNDVATLISSSDCLFQPSRAEGWNLPLIEAMACGKPCITTNYSAHTEFCNKDNSFLVDIEKTEIAEDGRYFFGQGEWASIEEKEKDQMVSHMRHVYKNDIRTNPNGLKTAKEFSWKNSATKLIHNLQAL
jgi:glycosyltransferase involved in cell wall biosynthesis